MIPASYLFKDLYRQHWIEASVDTRNRVAIEHRRRTGLRTLASALGRLPVAMADLVRARARPCREPLTDAAPPQSHVRYLGAITRP